MERNFSRFEGHIESLIEGSFARLFAGRLHPRDVAVRLARAMEDNAELGPGGREFAPDSYTVVFNSRDYKAIVDSDPDLVRKLGDEVVLMARAADMGLVRKPKVELVVGDNIPVASVTVTASHTEAGQTETMDASELFLNEPDIPDAALTFEDGRQINLDRPVINIGRHRENHVILEDPGASRHHAQLRLRFGKYTLFDIKSTAGTRVNGEEVEKALLKSGDVIQIASTKLTYTEIDKPAKTQSMEIPDLPTE